MKLTSKARYGLFLMAELCRQYNKSLVQIKTFAQQQSLSPKYLEQIVITLKSHNLLESLRGPHGGYRLNRPPSEINIYEILAVLQGGLDPYKCSSTKSSHSCPSSDQCVTKNLADILDQTIKEKFEQTSLESFTKSVPNFWEARCSLTSNMQALF